MIQDSYLIGNYARQPISFVKGEGSCLFDEEGRRYIDFGCGISVTNLGHVHPHVTAKVMRQAGTLWHTSNIFHNDLPARVAERLSKATFGGKVFFCNSGAEANEAAIKLARIYNNKKHGGTKPRIITMQNGFHGRTYATMSATGQDKIHKGFEPLVDFFTYVPYNDAAAVKAELDKCDVCAVMLELVQGESGVISADSAYVQEITDYAHSKGALVIFDEVQTGFGRSGDLFAYQHVGVIPDIMTMAKSIANGLPMGAIEAKPEIAELFTPGTHGTTFGGNLMACAAADAVLDVMLDKAFLPEVRAKGDIFRKMLESAFGAYKNVGIRGQGFLIGVDLGTETAAYINACLEEGLVVIAAGKTAVRFYPPLTASIEELEEGVSLAKKAMEKVFK